MGGRLPQLDLRHTTSSSGPRFPHLGKGTQPLSHTAAWGLRIGSFRGVGKAAVQGTGGQSTLLGQLLTPRSRRRATAASWASREVSGRESPRPGASRGGASRRRSSPACAGAGSRTSSGEDHAGHGCSEQLHDPAATAQRGSQTRSSCRRILCVRAGQDPSCAPRRSVRELKGMWAQRPQWPPPPWGGCLGGKRCPPSPPRSRAQFTKPLARRLPP